MFLGMIARFKRKLKPRDFCRIFNNANMGRKVYNRLLRKTGVHSEGDAVIRPPFVFERGNMRLGSRVFINAGCVFLDEGGIEVGAYSLIGPGVKICTVSHHVAPAERHDDNITGKVVLGENTWIGAGAVILPGVTIGANSVVAANSVVTKDIPANTLFAGSPAVFKKHL